MGQQLQETSYTVILRKQALDMAPIVHLCHQMSVRRKKNVAKKFGLAKCLIQCVNAISCPFLTTAQVPPRLANPRTRRLNDLALPMYTYVALIHHAVACEIGRMPEQFLLVR